MIRLTKRKGKNTDEIKEPAWLSPSLVEMLRARLIGSYRRCRKTDPAQHVATHHRRVETVWAYTEGSSRWWIVCSETDDKERERERVYE